jgi:hypothetical protein
VPEDNTQSQAGDSLIDAIENAYHAARVTIDSEVKQLVDQGREMQAVTVLENQVGTLYRLHAALLSLYLNLSAWEDALRVLGSKRLRELKYPIEYIFSAVDPEQQKYDSIILDHFDKSGFRTVTHPFVRQRLLTEIEYMIAVLHTMVEPDFLPLRQAPDPADADGSRPDRYIPPRVRIAVWRRDGGKCVECGSQERLEYDHIIPVLKGGSNTERNVQLLCEKCNRKKAAEIA